MPFSNLKYAEFEMKCDNKVWVIIPALNEEKHIGTVISKTKHFIKNVVVVNDGSKDRTAESSEKAGAVVISHAVNLGKGAALRTGCSFAMRKGAQKVVLLDADSQHEPEEIPKFLKLLERSDIVFSYRTRRENMPSVLKFGNSLISYMIFLLYGIRIKDTQCGYRAFNSRIYKKIRWKSSDYSMESEMVANVGKKKIKYSQLPIRTIYADNYKGTTVLDGIKIVFDLLWWRIFG